ncbi:hypothetical protein [Nocardioides sp. InS609-2]|uniref:hypothetical protein n=1 Tax=Nocardioides sp. InS609-2 TaxID=2760705 RepID=UPI0020BECAE0|nr:hypothetical protein [Nocardioides sp. InS609-2]
MRIVRALIAMFIAALLGTSILSVVPAGATDTLPTRVITGERQATTYRAFSLKGNIEAFPNGEANLQKKACGSCKFKTVNKVKTTAYGNYKTKIFTPPTGKWKWRVKVKAQGGYATSYSPVFATFFKGNKR